MIAIKDFNHFLLAKIFFSVLESLTSIAYDFHLYAKKLKVDKSQPFESEYKVLKIQIIFFSFPIPLQLFQSYNELFQKNNSKLGLTTTNQEP